MFCYMSMAKKISKPDCFLLVLTGFTCNNNCVICSVKGKEKNHPDRGFDAIAADLRQGAGEGYGSVEFTGGEPSIRRDALELVALARELGYETIAMSTNGRLFSYGEFCRKIIGAGLNKITFSLLGPTDKIHDAVTRTPGTFTQIVAGIKNAQKYDHVHINISSVISRLNYKNLAGFGKFIVDLGVKQWYLLDLIPDGSAKAFYTRLVVRLKDLYNEFNSLADTAERFKEFGFFDFPFCLFTPEMRNKTNAVFVNAKTRDDTNLQVGYDPKRISVDKRGKYRDAHRINIKICARCRYYKECGGIWKEYLDLYGEDEINKLVIKNKCLSV